ncbi:MAG: hypothetical protein GX322_01560 [Firmicutes bacterium]|nr:hypothetical protein [Bacillota bacterium]
MGELKIPVVIIVFIITLALLLLGQRFIFQQRSMNNLERQFEKLVGVDNATIRHGSGGLTATIQLSDAVGLKATYDEILVLARQSGILPHSIELRDARGPVLAEALYSIHYAIAEGIATGEFQPMAQVVQAKLAALGVSEWELWVEKEFVYLEMHHGSEHLCQVFSRDGTLGHRSELARGSGRREG